MTFETKARAYIKTIRNTNKRQYAVDYLNYLLNFVTEEPECAALGAMARQAVRMRLFDLMR
jgi:hypothetical protein